MQTRGYVALSFVALAIVGAGFGCGESVDSSDVATSGIYADFRARAGGDGTTNVEMQFKVGGATSNTTLEFQEGDEVTVTADGKNQKVQKRNAPVGDKTRYRASIGKDDKGTQIKVSLTRENYDDAPNSTTTLPSPFTIESPKADAEISRQSDLTVELSNAPEGSSQSIAISGDCIQTYSESFDGKTHTIPKGNIEKRDPDPDEDSIPDSCSANIDVDRVNDGSPDPAYGEGGAFPAVQDRDRSFTTKK